MNTPNNILTYRGTWGNATPFIGEMEAPTHDFAASIVFPSGDRVKALVISYERHHSVDDHGHTYLAIERRLRIRVPVHGLWIHITLPEGVWIDVLEGSTTQLFRRGDHVQYVPTHAGVNLFHKDVERGVVSSTNNHVVFVKYGVDSPDAPITAKATSPSDLYLHDRIDQSLQDPAHV